jgi:hypothetical protein
MIDECAYECIVGSRMRLSCRSSQSAGGTRQPLSTFNVPTALPQSTVCE